MNRKYMPIILMLVAGAVTCIITFLKNYSISAKLISLAVVLVLFYTLGSVLKGLLDNFEKQNDKKSKEEGEVIQKDAEEAEGEKENQQEA
ncbi:MAG: hypothetical protein E7287_05725 [Lachnospiraceae bacterium]|nr:hypothetical protein [Lachnospiraceae bacterium]